MALATVTSSKHPSSRPWKLWWLLAVVILAISVFVQIPAVWLLGKFAPDSKLIQQVSGNLWHGSAIVQLPPELLSNHTTPLTGSVTWQWRPWSVFLGKLGMDVALESGQTRLQGEVNRSLNQWQVQNWSGKIDKQTLSSLVSWQLPDAPIQVNSLSLSYDESLGFEDVDGQLTWVGGEMGYPSGNKIYQILLPAMRADISNENKDDKQVIHANLVDNNNKRLGDLYIDNDAMLDVSLTQRFLENMPEYNGSAPADTAVVSVRQPLLGGQQ